MASSTGHEPCFVNAKDAAFQRDELLHVSARSIPSSGTRTVPATSEGPVISSFYSKVEPGGGTLAVPPMRAKFLLVA
jgi:hypothetical protein